MACGRRSPRAEVPPSGAAREGEIPHLVPEPRAPQLEAGRGPLGGPVCEAALRGEIAQARRGAQAGQHLERVGLPVGRDLQHPGRLERTLDERDERALDQAALVMALLGPGVGKENQDLRETARRDLPLEHFDRVVADDADVARAVALEREQQAADAGTMHLDAEIVAPGMRARERGEVLAVAEADLERAGGLAAEELPRVERLVPVLDAVLRPQLPERALLCRSDAPCTRDERADRAWMRGIGHGRDLTGASRGRRAVGRCGGALA